LSKRGEERSNTPKRLRERRTWVVVKEENNGRNQAPFEVGTTGEDLVSHKTNMGGEGGAQERKSWVLPLWGVCPEKAKTSKGGSLCQGWSICRTYWTVGVGKKKAKRGKRRNKKTEASIEINRRTERI